MSKTIVIIANYFYLGDFSHYYSVFHICHESLHLIQKFQVLVKLILDFGLLIIISRLNT